MNECCICYNKTKSITKCNHPLCNKCTKALLKGSTVFKCPYCRRDNIFIDNRYIDVQTYNGRFINVPTRRLKTYLFTKSYKTMMEEHIKQKYNNFFMIYKYSKIIKMGQTFHLIVDLDYTTIEYILFCEIIDLPICRAKKYFIMDYFKDAMMELHKRTQL